jgi:dienelactone hydrolase
MVLRIRGLAVLTAVVLAACASGGGTGAGPGGRIPFQSIAGARGPANGLDGTLKLPPGSGPFPVVIVLHGCGGLGSNQKLWAERLNGWGYAAFVLDSFGPRGVRSVCAAAAQPLVTSSDRASDVISAALWLRGQPGVDPDRIGVLGGSHGGSTAAWVTQAVYEQRYPGLLKASVDYYGGCRVPETHGTVPLLALAGEADSWGMPAQTCQTFARKMRADQPFELHTYPGVVHAFDNPRQDRLVLNEGNPMLYNRDAAEDSYGRVHAFLDHWLKPAPHEG